jgi:hypothetical protein
MTKISYVAYIDESGDDGVARVSPVVKDGASEWFVLGAIVARSEPQHEVRWVKSILGDLKLRQRRHLHFQPLDERRRLQVCTAINRLPVRCFVAMSNKQNMHAYENPRAAKFDMESRTWFYWWMTRLLLERISDYCEWRSLREFGEPRLVRLEFSRRKGLRYAHFQAYLYWLRMQSKGNALYLDQGDIKWSVIDMMDQIRVYDHDARAGLQLADAVSGAFYQSVTTTPDYAIALQDRMAISASGHVFNFGIKLMPPRFERTAPAHQRAIFDHYIARDRRRAPGS